MTDLAIRVENLPKLSYIGSRERDKAVRDTLIDAISAGVMKRRETDRRGTKQTEQTRKTEQTR